MKKNHIKLSNFASKITSFLIELSPMKRKTIMSFITICFLGLSILIREFGKIYGPITWMFVMMTILIIPMFCNELGGTIVGALTGITITVKIFLYQEEVCQYLLKPDTLNFWLYIFTIILVFLTTSAIGYFLGKVRFTIIREIQSREFNAQIAEEKYTILAEQSVFGVMSLKDGKIIETNSGFSTILGYSYEEIKDWNSQKLAKIIHEEERQLFLSIIGKQYHEKSESMENKVFRILTKTNELKWVDFSFRRLLVGNETISILTIFDITDIKKAYDQLKHVADQISLLIDRIRNPLAVILGTVELKEKILAKPILEQINRIVTSLNQVEADIFITLKLTDELEKYLN